MRYVRVYTPTADYVKVLQNQMSLALNIRPGAAFSSTEKSAVRKFVDRWALQTALRVDDRTSEGAGLQGYNPFAEMADSLLIASNNNLRQSVFFNQGSPVFGGDYTYINNLSRQLLTNGIESRNLESHEVRGRVNMFRVWILSGTGLLSRKGFSSQFFTGRNYLIAGREGEAQLAFQPNTVLRVAGRYKYGEKQNLGPGTQRAYIHTQGVEVKSNQAEKGSFTGRIDFIMIRYNDGENSPVAFEMLGGLKPGNNITWEVGYQRNLNSNLQVSITYNGRRSPDVPVVHLGGAQIRAMF